MNWWLTALSLTVLFLVSGYKLVCAPPWELFFGRKLRPHRRGEFAFGLLLLISLISLTRATSIPLGYPDLFFYASMLWIALGIAWADEKKRTFRRTVQFGISAFAGISIASAFHFDERVAIVAACSALFLIVELVDGAVQGRLVDVTSRRFGTTALPNRQAINAFLLALCLTYFVESNTISTLTGLGFILVALTLLLLTQARAANWAGFLSYVVWLLASSFNSSVELSWFILVMPLAYLVLAAFVSMALMPRYPDATKIESLVHLGRKPDEVKDLNLRKPLWIYALQTARKRWILGHGYGAFWTPARSKDAAPWEPANAHSCYLDVFASTGIIGVALLGSFFVALAVAALGANPPQMQFVLALNCFVMLIAFMESTFWLGEFETFAFLILVLDFAPAATSV